MQEQESSVQFGDLPRPVLKLPSVHYPRAFMGIFSRMNLDLISVAMAPFDQAVPEFMGLSF
jgi:hypothetical protein